MQQTHSNVDRRSLRKRGANHVGNAPRTFAAIAIACLALVGSIANAPSSAIAAPEPSASSSESSEATPTPSPTPTETLGLADTTVSTAAFSGTGRAELSGTKQPGNRVTVTIASGARVCISRPADLALETWGCTTSRLPNGPDIELTAVETPESGPAPLAGTTRIDVLGPPSLDGDGSYLTTGLVSGSGFPGSVVRVSAASGDGGVLIVCDTVQVSPSSYWSCNIDRPTGGPYLLRAQQSNPVIADGRLSDFSNQQNVTVDRDAPASAVITSPASGSRVIQQPSTVTGTGENGARVDLYVDNVPVCSTIVAAGGWSCTIGELSPGEHALHTVQRDAAGNFASPSPVIRVAFGPPASVAPAPPPPAAPGNPAPGTPTPTPAPQPVPEPEPSTATPVPPFDRPIFPRSDGSGPTLAEALTNWGTPTGFGAGLTAFGESDARGGWYVSPILGLIFLALVAVPLRLLASALRGRMALPRGQLTGRNQRVPMIPEADVPKPVNAWLAAAVPLAVAAGLVVLAAGVNGEVRYVRLFLAVGLGLTIINVLGAALATRLGSHWNRVPSRLRFLPLMLLAAALAAFFARWTGMDPPLVVGVLAGAVFAASTPVRQRAMVNLTQVGVVAGIGLVGWIGHGLLGPVQGFWASVASETFATLCLAGLGSALVLVLPIATLPGRVILEWSLPAWLLTVVVISSVVAAVVFGDVIATVALLPWILAAAAFTALSLAVWAFVRFVEPRLV